MNPNKAFSFFTCILFSSAVTAQLDSNSDLIPASKALYADYLDKFETSGSSMQNRLLKKVADDLKTASIRFINATGRNEPLYEYSWACDEVKGGGEEQNLLVMPGGKILFFSEMFSLANSENKIAWYLSHGIAHTLIDEGEDNTIQDFGILGAEGKGFTHFEELLADQLGAKIMAIAGYDPKVGVDIWQELQDSEHVRYLDHHPFYEDRIMNLNNFAVDGKNVAREYGTTQFK